MLASTIVLALLARTAAQPPGDPSGGVGASTSSHPTASHPTASHSGETRISTAILRADGFERGELERAIQLRLPTLTLVGVGSEAPPATDGSLRAFIELRRVSPTQLELTLILADGRAYLRGLEVDADAPARPAASALANLIAAIEDDTVVADQSHVPLPPALIASEPAPAPVPAAICPEPPAPKPAPPTLSPPTSPPPAPRWELGPALHAGASLGLTPIRGLRGAGLGLALNARAPSGLLLVLDLQGLGRTIQQLQVQRLRIGFGVGYALRRGNFELPVAALVGVEPWRLTGDRGTVPISSMLGRPRPLIGLGLRIAPGLRAPLGRSGAQLRAGINVELWASGEAAPGVRSPMLLIPPSALSLGGLELKLGLELGVWFPVGPAPTRRPKTTGASEPDPKNMSPRTANRIP